MKILSYEEFLSGNSLSGGASIDCFWDTTSIRISSLLGIDNENHKVLNSIQESLTELEKGKMLEAVLHASYPGKTTRLLTDMISRAALRIHGK